VTVAYLGPEGTFSEQAAQRVAAEGETLLACSDVIDAVRQVESGAADRAVLPIENALQGMVAATLDMLAFDTDLLIQGELDLAVELVLAAPAGTTLADITEVRSHPIPLAGCRRWLAAMLPEADRRGSTSTARAAQEAAERGRGHAAIVNPLAAQRYGLEVLATGVADEDTNATRFVIVADGLVAPSGWDKTSLVVYIEANRPGALLDLLEVFAERDLQLTKIESRPTKAELGEYCFFLDVEGHLADEILADAIAAVKRTQREVKLLGSFPRAGEPSPEVMDRIVSDNAAMREAEAWLAGWRARIPQVRVPHTQH